MSFAGQLTGRQTVNILVVGLWVGMAFSVGSAMAEFCSLPPTHAGLIFPVERVDPTWACRLQAIIQSSTTESKVGPIRTALSESTYRYLLDHPPFTASLIRRLHLGLYQSEARGPNRFWGDDGEGTKGIVELVYEDPTNRIYFLEGTHESRVLRHVNGKAVVFLRIDVTRDANGTEATDSTLVAYTKLNNPFLSGLVSFFHPFVSRLVTSRLQKGGEIVNRLGITMRRDPQGVLFEAMTPPSLPEQHVAFLKEVLGRQNSPDRTISRDNVIP